MTANILNNDDLDEFYAQATKRVQQSVDSNLSHLLEQGGSELRWLTQLTVIAGCQCDLLAGIYRELVYSRRAKGPGNAKSTQGDRHDE